MWLIERESVELTRQYDRPSQPCRMRACTFLCGSPERHRSGKLDFETGKVAFVQFQLKSSHTRAQRCASMCVCVFPGRLSNEIDDHTLSERLVSFLKLHADRRVELKLIRKNEEIKVISKNKEKRKYEN